MTNLRSIAIAVVAILAIGGVAACEPADPGFGSTAGTAPGNTGRISGGAASLDALAEELVAAISAGDSAALESYRLTEREHNEVVWPELPIALQDDHDFPVALAWENIEVRNSAGIRRLLARYGGEPLRSAGIACDGETEEYPSFTVVRDCRVTVVSPGGELQRLQMFRVVVASEGRYKIVRFRRDME